jgi:molybdopterin synthase catalytic subunit
MAQKNTEESYNDHNTTVVITSQVLDVAAINRLVERDEAGAVASFYGTTRNTFGGRVVVRLEYEAYSPMAVKEIVKLCDKARTTWVRTQHKLTLAHRSLQPVRLHIID